ncbi:NAD-dependent epimerase/dehydratase family protein [Seohaeicola saemankumensis]|nr:NAD-dependent epimerase/dehydratase family protein [Seohaeicola saemankumensis]MCA0871847.1 NAD-dependent epimerase/dehydratase family protein [Seohaeicola saemankumensis]
MPTPLFDTENPVLVTGATGYVAGWVIKGLLDAGLTVHATVRDPGDSAKLAHLEKMATDSPGTIRYFKADLLQSGAFDDAMAGCRVVLHTASPFTTSVADPQRDLVDPAVGGTRNVLASANRTDSVGRVVVTSSCAAIYGDSADCGAAPGGVLTEEVWNTSASLTHNPYSYSKTMAERAAWEMAEEQDRWQLVTVNPSLVLGPGLARTQTSESFNIIRQMANGLMRTGAPNIEFGTVDVRDVADAHVRAAYVPDAQGRNIVNAETNALLDLAAMINDAYPALRVPHNTLPKWMVWMVGPFLSRDLSRRFIERNVDHDWRADNSKGIRELGISYRPIKTAVAEMVSQMGESGQIRGL